MWPHLHSCRVPQVGEAGVQRCDALLPLSAEEAGASVSFRVDPVLREVHEAVCSTAIDQSEAFYLVAPRCTVWTLSWTETVFQKS